MVRTTRVRGHRRLLSSGRITRVSMHRRKLMKVKFQKRLLELKGVVSKQKQIDDGIKIFNKIVKQEEQRQSEFLADVEMFDGPVGDFAEGLDEPVEIAYRTILDIYPESVSSEIIKKALPNNFEGFKRKKLRSQI